jgi:hypothetical protein
MKVGLVFILVFSICSIGQSQIQNGESGASARGSLTVTATVAPSVWLVMEPDGEQNIVVANTPDPRESFSRASTKTSKKSTRLAKKQNSSIAKSQGPPQKQDDASIDFDFPTVSKQFDVTHKTIIVNVSEGAKTVARRVIVTTVVVQ